MDASRESDTEPIAPEQVEALKIELNSDPEIKFSGRVGQLKALRGQAAYLLRENAGLLRDYLSNTKKILFF